MWRSGTNSSDNENVYATQYIYYRDKQVNCGDDFWWGKLPENLAETDKQLFDACSDMWYAFNRFNYYGSRWPCSYWGKLKPYFAHFKAGEWNTVRTYIRMNDADKTEAKNSNSVIKTWLNDELVLDLQGLVLRDSDNFGIDAFYFSTFAGGSSEAEFAPQTKDQVFYFDDFKIWEGEKPTDGKPKEPTAISKPEKPKIRPAININQRNLSVSVPNAPNMAVTIFLPNGRKIADKRIVGDNGSLPLPRAAKGVIIVTIDANRNYYSQRVVID
jgi:hypothetical protein